MHRCTQLGFLFLLSLWSPLAFADGPFRTVALWHDATPGDPGGQFARFAAPYIDHAGGAVFTSDIVGGTGGVGLWSESGGFPLHYQSGTQPPGFPATDEFYFLRGTRANADGEVLFLADIDQPGLVISQYPRALYSTAGGTPDLVITEGDPAPGGPAGNVLQDIYESGLNYNSSGTLTFTGDMQIGLGGVTSNDRRAIWRGTNSVDLAMLARQGDPAVDAPATNVYKGLFSPRMNEAGQVIFEGTHGDPSMFFDQTAAVWSDVGGSMAMILEQGDLAPSAAPAGAVWGNTFDDPTLNTAGQIAFINQLEIGPGGVTTANDTTLWTGTPGSLNLIAREGDPAAGVPGSERTFISSLVHNAAGDVAFYGGMAIGPGGVTSDNDRGLWRTVAGVPELVVRNGDPVPGVPGGIFSNVFGLGMNDAGQIVFSASLELGPGGVTLNDSFGVWAQNPAGDIVKVIRAGDALDVDDGPGVDLRTVESFQYTGNQQHLSNDIGLSSFFNPSGELAITLIFDGAFGDQGVFVWDSNLAFNVPEPGTLAKLAWLVVPLAGRGRRTR